MKLALVLTAQNGLGALLRETLTSLGMEAAVYDRLPSLPADAAPALVVLDGDLATTDTLTSWLEHQRAHAPACKVLYLATGKGEAAPPADAVLSAPLYLPDFIAAARRLLAEAPPTPRPPWLSDVRRAAQHLARLSMEAAAQAAALVTPAGRLWAYAGELPQPAAEELARLTANYWDWQGEESKDIARFLRLEALQQDLLLYATAVTDDLVLAMAFDVQVPFSRIRAQAIRLAEALTAAPPSDEPPPPTKAAHAATLPTAAEALPADEALPRAELPLLTATPAPEDTFPDAAPLLDDLPPEATQPLFDDVPPPEPQTPPTAPVSPQERLASTAAPVEVAAPPQAGDVPALVRQAQDQPAPEVAGLPASPPARAAIYYACVLIPRFPQHTLAGDLARDLSQWMPQIATAFGWRLRHLAVRPDAMQWIVQTPPETSPAEVLRTVRQHTSERIFAAYPHLAETNPSGHFWAPGYLLLSQNQPIPEATIQAFLTATRSHQGLASGE